MSHKRNTKQSSGLTQPTLSFQSRRPTTNAKAKNLAKTSTAARQSSVSSVSSVDRPQTPPVPAKATKSKPSAAKEKEVIEVEDDTREVLDPNSKEWDGLYKQAKAEMGDLPPIHAGPQTSKVANILRVFDLTAKYGPCVGISRLERWERAHKWGLNPPEEIKKILLTQQGEDNVDLRESILHGWV